jgi:ABC-type Na+ efflux pump permease subunit
LPVQIINNIALTEFDTDISKYTATLKDVIAACMDGVEPEDIINIVITSVTGSNEAGRRALQEGESAIMAAYEVQSDDSTETYENLSTQLMEAVTSGEFDTIMGQTATENGATDLEDATSDSVTTSSTTTDTVLMYAEQVRHEVLRSL